MYDHKVLLSKSVCKGVIPESFSFTASSSVIVDRKEAVVRYIILFHKRTAVYINYYVCMSALIS